MSSSLGTILVIDDNRMQRMVVARNLQQIGHLVREAESGVQALARLRAEPMDVVLLDIEMPEMDGYQVLEQIMADPALREIPVIMVTGIDDVTSAVTCIEMGATDYLSKPVNAGLLRARIDNSLVKKRARDREQELYRQLQESFAKLQELEKLRNDLTHMIVHDLRTPLTSIVTGFPTIELAGDLNELQREVFDMALRGGQTLLGMINDLLDVSKMESGTMTLELAPFQVAAVVERAGQQVAALTTEKGIHLVVEIAPEIDTCVADEDKLRRTLVNLLGNAVKFTPQSGTIRVGAQKTEDGSSLHFSVADSGEGIPPEAFEKIFEKFGQVESRQSGRRMSTGLGLTFCKMAVEAHGGRIWVESELGQGSTFSFIIPLTG